MGIYQQICLTMFMVSFFGAVITAMMGFIGFAVIFSIISVVLVYMSAFARGRRTGEGR